MTKKDVVAADDERSAPRATSKPPVSRKRSQATSARPARAAETRANTKVRKEEDEPWTNPSSLKAPPARPGMVQRWIRVAMQGRADPTNLARKLREGWKARPADSAPADFAVPRLTHGTFAGAIGVEGMVLMEMPKTRNAQRNAFFKKRQDAVTQAIDEDLLRANAGTGTAYGAIKRAARSIPVREKQVVAAGDEVGDTE